MDNRGLGIEKMRRLSEELADPNEQLHELQMLDDSDATDPFRDRRE